MTTAAQHHVLPVWNDHVCVKPGSNRCNTSYMSWEGSRPALTKYLDIANRSQPGVCHLSRSWLMHSCKSCNDMIALREVCIVLELTLEANPSYCQQMLTTNLHNNHWLRRLPWTRWAQHWCHSALEMSQLVAPSSPASHCLIVYSHPRLSS